MLTLFKLFSHFPLALLHGLGVLLGWLVFALSGTYRRRFLSNAAQAGYRFADVWPAIGHAGRMTAELPRLWFGAPSRVRWQGESLVEQALLAGRGIVFLTPHLGCFEIAAQAVARRYGAQLGQLTVLYRPARQPWLAQLMAQARGRPGLALAPTTLGGVRSLIKALRAGQAVGMLPDQVPPQGMGIWTPFFGRDAYTMVLGAKLALQTGASVLLVWGERLSWGRGYVLHVSAPSAALPEALDQAVLQVNQEMERLVRQRPGQYLWGYARYKTPREAA